MNNSRSKLCVQFNPVNKILELRYGPGGVGHDSQSVLGGMATVRNNYLLK